MVQLFFGHVHFNDTEKLLQGKQTLQPEGINSGYKKPKIRKIGKSEHLMAIFFPSISLENNKQQAAKKLKILVLLIFHHSFISFSLLFPFPFHRRGSHLIQNTQDSCTRRSSSSIRDITVVSTSLQRMNNFQI
ncbi:hypothetical protein NE237_000160 [Protea cynaroides]|uniref:Uncharacterized protein n=1 Tax=Protea cynaroides TaxID=273540 RepID=A0A9Q0GP17_9MAGN|nr:hypothetical protein NE237_000160 [Protea cynaroides]